MNQLELFPADIYDNRIKQVYYAIKLTNKMFNWSPYDLDSLIKGSTLFKVSCEDIIKQYEKIIQNESKLQSVS